jgi:sulfoxide reductase heme-binding subunit YedZ
MAKWWWRPATHLLCLLPLLLLVWRGWAGQLGPDPGEAVMGFTGEWGLRLLAATLLVSPLRHWSGRGALITLRRPLGLWAFAYAVLHLLTFCHFYLGWTAALFAEELAERPYITLGFTAWLLLLPLALTSTRGMQRRLRRNWQRLHRLIYPAVVLACLHLLWQSRSDIGEALAYMGVFALLLAWRLRRRKHSARSAIATS